MSRTTWTLARQAEVRHALANGRTFADIADKMGITWQAVAQGATVYSLRPVCRKGSWTPSVSPSSKSFGPVAVSVGNRP